LSKYLLKGRQVAVQGELRQDRWEKDGQQRSKVVIVANNIRPLGPAPQTNGEISRKTGQESVHNAMEPNNSQPSVPTGIDEFTDDIPF